MKILKNVIILHMCTKNHNHMMYGSWFGQIFFALLPPLPPTPPPPYIDPKNQFFDKKWKKCLEILSFYTYMSTIMKIYDIWFLKYKVQQTEIFTILEHFFCPFRPLTSWKIKILLLRKNAWRYHFTHVYQKWQSHDEWFLRYRAQPTEFFVILNHFMPFYPKNQNFEKKEKNARRYYYFTQVWHKWQSYDQGIIQIKMAVGIWFWVPNLDLISPNYD